MEKAGFSAVEEISPALLGIGICFCVKGNTADVLLNILSVAVKKNHFWNKKVYSKCLMKIHCDYFLGQSSFYSQDLMSLRISRVVS